MRQLTLILFLALFANGFCQDLHLSQFYTNAANLNPALSGDYEGSYQFVGNYRNQWREIGTPLNTYFISADKKMFFFRDEIDVGVLLCEDRFLDFNQKMNKILIHGAYKKKLFGHTFSAGIQLGGIFRSTDLSAQTFPNQWVYENGTFDQSVSSGEVALTDREGFFDATIGIGWTKTFPKMTATAGFSLSHFNRPKDSYFSVFRERLRSRKNFSGKLIYHLKPKLNLESHLLYMFTTKAEDLVIGTGLKKIFNASGLRHINAGLFFRTGFNRNRDAIIPMIGFGYQKFDIGISYDINISALSQVNAVKSTFELSFIYTLPLFEPQKLSIPCERY